jgi:NAD(P)-dependent dehydrogenase (short-subunit alcohol dehydrogenase family)
VTGGARGIGAAIAEKFRAEGAMTAILDLDLPPLDAADFALACDITNEDQVRHAVEKVSSRLDGIDILVNNAGVNTYFDAALMTVDEWDRVFAVDLKGAWLCSKHVLPHLIAGGGGSIVNIASVHARMTIKGMFPYAAAKSAIVGLTRSLALDYASANIRVNAVCPGWTNTRLVREWIDRQPDPQASERTINSLQPLGRMAEPSEIANVVAFLASPEASFMTGTEVYVDGGFSVQAPT